MASSGRGQVLVPWPNRLRDGRYEIDGTTHELPITEQETGNASHGLTRWEGWRLRERHDDAVVVSHTIHPRPGWPFHVEVVVAWVLDGSGLTCTTQATNVGDAVAPWGYGAHPYLALAGTPAAQARVRVPAARVLLVDDRMLPADLVEVGGTPSTCATASRSASATSTTPTPTSSGARTAAGRSRWPRTGSSAGWGGPGLDWVQVFTGKARDEGTPGVAVEPLSCPADAYNTGVGLVRLEPGQTWTAQWGLEAQRV